MNSQKLISVVIVIIIGCCISSSLIGTILYLAGNNAKSEASTPTPTESKPIESKPTESTPTESKPTEPTEPKPTESKPTEPKLTESKPIESKPTESTLAPPPPDNPNKSYTPWNDESSSNIILDRHNVTCNNKPITDFVLQRDNNGKMRYEYGCLNKNVESTENKKTPPNDDGDGQSIYLDRHNVDCQGKPITAFHLKRPSDNQINYEYTCGTNELSDIRELKTENNDWGDANTLFLDRHNLKCPENLVLSQFKLTRPAEDKISYKYKCGKLN